MNEQQAPIKEGEICTVSVNAVGGKGDGIAKIKGFVLFIAGAKKGDYLKVKVTKVLKNAGFAEIIEKLERPKFEKKFETVSMDELKKDEYQPNEKYEETDDFGEDLDDEE